MGCGSTKGRWRLGSPIWGISARRALWSLYSVRSVVVVDFGWGISFGIRSSQWSIGELVGVYVGVSVSPMGVSIVYVKRPARDLWKEARCGEGIAWRSPPRRAGVLGCFVVSRVWSH